MASSEPTHLEETSPAASSIPGLPPDWPRQATSRIVTVVDTVRVKTSGPAIGVSRIIVYGLVVALLAPIALVLLAIAAVRGLDEIFPGQVGPIYLVLGGVFTLAGLLCWSRRPRRAAG